MSVTLAGSDEPGNVIDLVAAQIRRARRRHPSVPAGGGYQHTSRRSLTALDQIHANAVDELERSHGHDPGA